MPFVQRLIILQLAIFAVVVCLAILPSSSSSSYSSVTQRNSSSQSRDEQQQSSSSSSSAAPAMLEIEEDNDHEEEEMMLECQMRRDGGGECPQQQKGADPRLALDWALCHFSGGLLYVAMTLVRDCRLDQTLKRRAQECSKTMNRRGYPRLAATLDRGGFVQWFIEHGGKTGAPLASYALAARLRGEEDTAAEPFPATQDVRLVLNTASSVCRWGALAARRKAKELTRKARKWARENIEEMGSDEMAQLTNL